MSSKDPSSATSSFKTLNASRSANTFIKPGELIDVVELTALTLQDRRIYNMLLANAWDSIEEDKVHQAAKKDLRQESDSVNFRVSQSLDRLMSAFVKVKLERNRRTVIQRISLLGTNEEDWHQDGIFRYKFPSELRDIVKQSTVFARLQKTIMYAFKCKYALALYEIVQKRGQLKYKHFEDFDVEEFRGLLGVPPGKLQKFSNFNAWAIKPAIKEVNFLSDYIVTVEPIKKGRTVYAIKLSWMPKNQSDMKCVFQELERSTIGRQARMEGTVEQIESVDFISSSGKVVTEKESKVLLDAHTLEKARDIVYQSGTGWDIYAIEKEFIEYSRAKGKPHNINAAFLGFVRKKVENRP
ncbi:MAG: replication initiation protein [Cyanobacteria bacterium P01_A01_bin.40]